jgi:hypothetical protein
MINKANNVTMIKFNDFLKKNIVYLIFLIIAMFGIGLLKGAGVVLMLALFLLLFGSYCYTIVTVYNIFRGLKESGIIILCLISSILTVIVYYLYDISFLIKIISLASVISFIMIVLVNIKLKNK